MSMNCKFCFAELEDGVTVCPVCGKDLTEETPAEETAVEEVVVSAEETAEETFAEEETETLPEEPKKKRKGLKIALAIFSRL